MSSSLSKVTSVSDVVSLLRIQPNESAFFTNIKVIFHLCICLRFLHHLFKYLCLSLAIPLCSATFAFKPSFSTKCSWLISLFHLGTEANDISIHLKSIPLFLFLVSPLSHWPHCFPSLKWLVVSLDYPKCRVSSLWAEELTLIFAIQKVGRCLRSQNL